MAGSMIRPRFATFLLIATLAGCSHLSRQVAGLSDSLPGALQGKPDAETQFHVARLQERNGKLGKALELYSDLQQRDPDNPKVYHRMATVSSQRGDHEAAVRYFRQALEHAPDDTDILADLGYELFLTDELDKSERVLRRAVQMDPKHERAINNLAIVTGHLGNFEESFRLFRRVNTAAESHANLAYIHVQRGEGEKAVNRYSRALTLDKDLKSAKHGLVQLARARGQSGPGPITEQPEPVASSRPGRVNLSPDAETPRPQGGADSPETAFESRKPAKQTAAAEVKPAEHTKPANRKPAKRRASNQGEQTVSGTKHDNTAVFPDHPFNESFSDPSGVFGNETTGEAAPFGSE